ncbi:MAG: type II toxin-antitoxin system RelE/ParE family toxin [Methylococcales bacterium]
MKPIRVRPRANTEIDTSADYIAYDSPDAAMRFLDAVRKSFDLIGEQPGIGTQHYAHLPGLKGLRMLTVSDFEKHLVFYIERSDYIDVLRVLHGSRDIPVALLEGSKDTP